MKLNTPLRYPGGKSRAVKNLYGWFPSGIQEYREPFIGGGSMAIHFTKLNPDIPVWVNDKYFLLYNFWIHLQERGDELSDILIAIKTANNTDDLAKELFNSAKQEINQADPFRQAVLFWVLNKCSYSGLTENSAFSASASRQNFTIRGAKRLKEYSELIQHWEITNIDYAEVMNESGEDTFVFLDPPYDIKSFLYGGNKAELHRTFDHERFAQDVEACPHDFMITYNKNEQLEARFSAFQQRHWSITYGMQHRPDNKKQELLITNYDIEPATPIEALFNG